MYRIIVLFLTLYFISPSLDASEDDPTPTLKMGAQVFQERCVLCHGQDGLGEGILALKLKDYPDTNLVSKPKAITRAQIHQAVVYGGTLDDYSEFMPPMGNDLTWSQVESVVDFVSFLRSDFEKADALLSQTTAFRQPDRLHGKHLYESRCTLCHGELGEGDGRMARVIKSPPPANLTLSKLPDDYLKLIISKGGAGVSRSPQMPPWGDQFEPFELDSIILYVKSLRK